MPLMSSFCGQENLYLYLNRSYLLHRKVDMSTFLQSRKILNGMFGKLRISC
jgi:hypothetical protein